MSDDVVAAIAQHCRAWDRDDLADAIDAAEQAAAAPTSRVLVCGEFKVGKSRRCVGKR